MQIKSLTKEKNVIDIWVADVKCCVENNFIENKKELNSFAQEKRKEIHLHLVISF